MRSIEYNFGHPGRKVWMEKSSALRIVLCDEDNLPIAFLDCIRDLKGNFWCIALLDQVVSNNLLVYSLSILWYDEALFAPLSEFLACPVSYTVFVTLLLSPPCTSSLLPKQCPNSI